MGEVVEAVSVSSVSVSSLDETSSSQESAMCFFLGLGAVLSFRWERADVTSAGGWGVRCCWELGAGKGGYGGARTGLGGGGARHCGGWSIRWYGCRCERADSTVKGQMLYTGRAVTKGRSWW